MSSHPLTSLAAPGIAGLSPYEPGQPVEEVARAYGVQDIVKLASNENPLGPPASVVAAIADATHNLMRYPDGGAFELKERLAKHHGVAVEQLIVGNGSNDVLALVAETFLTPDTSAVFDAHAFIVYSLVTQATGATALRCTSRASHHPTQPLGHDPERLIATARADTRVVFIANPNNPTGSWLTETEIRGVLDHAGPETIVVLDEAYAEYVTEPEYPDGVALLQDYPNLLVTRTFSKIYSLAGLRVGYGIARAELIELLNRVRQPFNTSSVAQAAARAALDTPEFVAAARAANGAGLAQLSTGLRGLGLSVLPSVANFVLVDFGKPAHGIYEELLRAGVIVRPLGNYGLPNHLRISVGLPAENERLLAALAELPLAAA